MLLMLFADGVDDNVCDVDVEWWYCRGGYLGPQFGWWDPVLGWGRWLDLYGSWGGLGGGFDYSIKKGEGGR